MYVAYLHGAMSGLVKRESDIFPYPEFNPRTTQLLIELTQQHWDQYKINKTQFYQMLHGEFLAHGYNISAQKIRKKWNNLLVTYKRTKDRTRLSGETRITWEYFEALDSILSQTVGAPAISRAALSTALFPAVSEQPPAPALVSPSPVPCTPVHSLTRYPDGRGSHTDSCVTTAPTTSRQHGAESGRRRSASPDATDMFLENYEEHALRRTKVLESLANRHARRNLVAERRRESREMRREKREEDMLACLKDVSSSLRHISEQQDRIIALLEKRP
ncbi:uncharacterized protein LOC133131677 isoform X1 [Conger conger]|uniref:uncharacterized protein LOC133131677 isoform X1 n=1 Tax=Conger conger TaxID=82655 RepID=UPI002A599595|nr:uncharacterized protein LOC133131677 isoform X1 [Conger conger]